MSKTWECGKCGRNNPPSSQEVPDLELPRKEATPTKTGRSKATGTVDVVVASPTMRRVRSAVHVEKHVDGSSRNRVRESEASVCAEFLCSCGGGGGREAPCPARAASGDRYEDRRRQSARSFVLCWRPWTFPSQLSRGSRRGTRTSTRSCRPNTGSSPTLGPQNTQDQAQSGPGFPPEGKQEVQGVGRRREESVKALLLAKQRLTQQAKDARDEKARELEAVEAEARIAREGNVQRPPDQVTITDESSTVGSRTAERFGRRRKGELQPGGSTNTALRRNSPCSCLNNCWPKCRQRCRCRPRLFVRRSVQPRRVQPRPPRGQRSMWRRYRLQVNGGRRQQASFSTTGARVEVSTLPWARAEAWK